MLVRAPGTLHGTFKFSMTFQVVKNDTVQKKYGDDEGGITRGLEIAGWLENTSRFIIPLYFILFNIFYWIGNLA